MSCSNCAADDHHIDTCPQPIPCPHEPAAKVRGGVWTGVVAGALAWPAIGPWGLLVGVNVGVLVVLFLHWHHGGFGPRHCKVYFTTGTDDSWAQSE